MVEMKHSCTTLKAEEHSKASVETARLNVGTRERTVQRRKLEAMVADLEVDLEEVAMENIVTTARPLAMTSQATGNFTLNLLHSSTRVRRLRTVVVRRLEVVSK